MDGTDTELERLQAEVKRLQAERDRWHRLADRYADDRDAMAKSLTEASENLERARDSADAAWSLVSDWRGYAEAAEHALAAEGQERDAIVRLEVERLSGHTPKRRGRPPSWSAEAEAEVERLHRAGASIRQIAADLHTNKSQVHRVIARVRHQQAEAAERARLVAIADGRSPAQREALGAKRAAERRPVEPFDADRAECYFEYLRNRPT